MRPAISKRLGLYSLWIMVKSAGFFQRFYLHPVFFILVLLFFFPVSLRAQEWFRSNQAGMALERISSRMVALHFEWALSVQGTGYAALPDILRRFYNVSYALEQRLLYERGTLKRRQWIFRDRGGITRMNASLPADLSSIGKVEGGEVPPFVEIFSANRFLSETYQYLASGVYITRYFYQEGLLIRAETFLDSEPLWIDYYRYTRLYLLRGVERKYQKAGLYAQPLQGTSSRPPVTPLGLDLRDAPPIPGFITPGFLFDNSIMTEVLASIYAVKAARVIYDMDSQGRIITETHYNKEDKVLAIINNEWENDKISAIRWSAPPNEGRVVFRYSGKDRISEEDYRNGVLERRVNRQGDNEIEEIYMNGKAILRAVWNNGRKVSEERLR